jgi:uncharacterized protein (TIGR03435 family)
MIRKVLLILCSAVLAAQVTAPPAFEVASIKPSKPGTPGAGGLDDGPRGNRFTTRSVAVRRLMMRAYEIADWQITGGPKWLDSDRYDIDAKPAHPARREEINLMLRTLLADRFKLMMHRETEERRLFELQRGSAGSKLTLNDREPDGQQDVGFAGQGHVVFRNVGMPRLAVFLSVQTGHAVVDRTGLTGRYDFKLDFRPTRVASDHILDESQLNDPSRPGIVTAVREQLGLTLVTRKGSVEIFHIDHLQRPTDT